MLLPRACSLVLVLLVAPPAAAHKSPSPPPTTAASSEPAASAGPSVEASDQEQRPQPAPLVIDPRAAMFHHPHNKIVHFPIALGSMGALLLLLSYRWPQFGAGARLLLVLAALSAWMAVRSGEAQEADLEGGELGAWLGRHEDFGKWTAWALSLTAILALIKQARAVHWLLALIVLGLVSYTGFLGGILAHTPM